MDLRSDPTSIDSRPCAWILPRPPPPATLPLPFPAAEPGSAGSVTGSVATGPFRPKPKKQRAGKPKVRTGCVTCKLRRVKCDERKPSCQRCEGAKVACRGYPTPEQVAEKRRRGGKLDVQRRSQPRLLSPRTPTASALTVSTRPQDQSHEMLGEPSRPLSAFPSVRVDQGDGVYFDYFRSQVANNSAGYYTSSIWSHLVIGEGLKDECIHHSILAVGALIRAVSEPSWHHGRNQLHTKDGNIDSRHHETALRYHLRVVKTLRERIAAMAASTPRAVVVTTLLLVVFELVQGQTRAAESLLEAGMGLLRDFITLFDRGSDEQGRRTRTPVHKLQDIDYVLPCISVMSHLSYLFRPQRRHVPLFRLDPDFDFPSPPHDPISEFFVSWGRFFTFSIIFVSHATSVAVETQSADKLARLRPRQQLFMTHLEKWQSIIHGYGASSSVDESSKKAMRIAQIHWLLLSISVACCLDPTQVACDEFEKQYEELTSLCTGLYRDSISHPRPTSVLLGQGLILPLCTVIRSCRNHDIRMKAVEAIRHLPSSMVSWDILSTIEGLMGAVLLEELGRNEDGFVPPESRWLWLRDEIDQSTGTSEKVYQRLLPDDDGRPVLERLALPPDPVKETCKARKCQNRHSLDTCS